MGELLPSKANPTEAQTMEYVDLNHHHYCVFWILKSMLTCITHGCYCLVYLNLSLLSTSLRHFQSMLIDTDTWAHSLNWCAMIDMTKVTRYLSRHAYPNSDKSCYTVSKLQPRFQPPCPQPLVVITFSKADAERLRLFERELRLTSDYYKSD